MPESETHGKTQRKATPTLAQSTRVFAKIGLLSFGGPAAQIALMHREIVDRNKWLTEQQFLGALSFCMLLPGPEAMQLATYAGWRLHGIRGGLAAGLLFVLPGAFVVLALSMIYASYGSVDIVETLFTGIKAAVLIIVIDAFRRIAGRALGSLQNWIIAGLSFVAIFLLDVPFPVIVLAAGIYGFMANRKNGEGAAPITIAVSLRNTLGTIGVWSAVWLLPLVAILMLAGPDNVLSQLAWFFSKLAVVTFGGAYAVLAYMAQDAVGLYGWLQPGEMLDGLGLAETTPGPLILVTEFVGYLAAYRHGTSSPWFSGLLGAAVTLWATFAPCFLWIFAGAPYIEWIDSKPSLKGALAAITAAVVGVILNLAVWFGLHVFFSTVAVSAVGPIRVWLPETTSLNLTTLGLALVSAIALLGFRWTVPATLALSSLLALVLSAFGY